MDFASAFRAGLDYPEFLDRFGNQQQRALWDEYYRRVRLNDDQRSLLQSFKRELNVLCLAGTWCGDCVQQCPIFHAFESESPAITVRFVDRDQDEELKEAFRLCGAARVPQVVFLSEEFEFVGRYGDRTLARYREMAAQQLGASCPTGIVGSDGDPVLDDVVQDWLNEFERIHWMLRLSPRLRQIHND